MEADDLDLIYSSCTGTKRRTQEGREGRVCSRSKRRKYTTLKWYAHQRGACAHTARFFALACVEVCQAPRNHGIEASVQPWHRSVGAARDRVPLCRWFMICHCPGRVDCVCLCRKHVCTPARPCFVLDPCLLCAIPWYLNRIK